jgi:hypothetical protein
MFALGTHSTPANATSLSPFAHDAAGRPVLEFYPATAVKFSAQGLDLVSVTVKETPPENDARLARPPPARCKHDSARHYVS